MWNFTRGVENGTATMKTTQVSSSHLDPESHTSNSILELVAMEMSDMRMTC